jgi:hypothetical protein
MGHWVMRHPGNFALWMIRWIPSVGMDIAGPELTWSYFVGRDLGVPTQIVGVPAKLERATIIIPAVTINGHTYESQEL